MFLLKVIVVAVAFLFFNTDAETPDVEEKDLLDDRILPIVEVFNTTQRLWQYQQNITSTSPKRDSVTPRPTKKERRCVFLEKYNITNKDVYLRMERKRFGIQNSWASTLLHGTFESDGGLGRMQVNYKGRRSGPYKILDLVYKDTNCSVFIAKYYSQSGISVCELFVEDQQAPYGPTTGCSDYFNENCTGDTLVFYNETCSVARNELTSTQRP
uniref:Lipocalin n=1 Tax=Rhipicephalus zambeziensis TaxID=60191 RepID=A0A224YCC8_9ACAR